MSKEAIGITKYADCNSRIYPGSRMWEQLRPAVGKARARRKMRPGCMWSTASPAYLSIISPDHTVAHFRGNHSSLE
jgi:hypothetical protein